MQPSSHRRLSRVLPCWRPRVANQRAGANGATRAYVQEQTQIIKIAIGKPTAMMPAIVKVNAKSRFTSGRTLSIDMSLTPPLGENRNPQVGCDSDRRWLTND